MPPTASYTNLAGGPPTPHRRFEHSDTLARWRRGLRVSCTRAARDAAPSQGRAYHSPSQTLAAQVLHLPSTQAFYCCEKYMS